MPDSEIELAADHFVSDLIQSALIYQSKWEDEGGITGNDHYHCHCDDFHKLRLYTRQYASTLKERCFKSYSYYVYIYKARMTGLFSRDVLALPNANNLGSVAFSFEEAILQIAELLNRSRLFSSTRYESHEIKPGPTFHQVRSFF